MLLLIHILVINYRMLFLQPIIEDLFEELKYDAAIDILNQHVSIYGFRLNFDSSSFPINTHGPENHQFYLSSHYSHILLLKFPVDTAPFMVLRTVLTILKKKHHTITINQPLHFYTGNFLISSR